MEVAFIQPQITHVSMYLLTWKQAEMNSNKYFNSTDSGIHRQGQTSHTYHRWGSSKANRSVDSRSTQSPVRLVDNRCNQRKQQPLRITNGLDTKKIRWDQGMCRLQTAQQYNNKGCIPTPTTRWVHGSFKRSKVLLFVRFDPRVYAKAGAVVQR